MKRIPSLQNSLVSRHGKSVGVTVLITITKNVFRDKTYSDQAFSFDWQLELAASVYICPWATLQFINLNKRWQTDKDHLIVIISEQSRNQKKSISAASVLLMGWAIVLFSYYEYNSKSCMLEHNLLICSRYTNKHARVLLYRTLIKDTTHQARLSSTHFTISMRCIQKVLLFPTATQGQC